MSVVMEFSRRGSRSRLQQVRQAYRERVLPALADYCGYTADEMHEALLMRLYGRRDVEFRTCEQMLKLLSKALYLAAWLNGPEPFDPARVKFVDPVKRGPDG